MELNRLGACYVVVGGFAVIEAGFPRFTQDLDLLVDVSPENEARVFEALRSLPDKAVDELDPGDVERFAVVRVGAGRRLAATAFGNARSREEFAGRLASRGVTVADVMQRYQRLGKAMV